MLKKLTNNLGLKILALVFSSVLWLVSININDPVSTETFDTEVQLVNLDALIGSGKYVEIMDNTDYIRVTVRATRSVLTALEDSNIKAIADVSKVDEFNRVPIELSTTKTNEKVEKMTGDHEYLELNLETIKKVQLPIAVNVQSEPAADYVLGGTSTSQNAVIVSGPETVVRDVAYAAVDINIDGAVSDVNISLPVKLYTEDGIEVRSSKLTQSVEEVSTTATILMTKTVPVEYSYVGNCKKGYEVIGDIKSTINEIEVSGKPSAIKNISKVEVTEAIDISEASKTIEGTVDVKKYLPNGIGVVDSKKNTKAVVTVRIKEIIEEEDEE